MTIKTSKGYIEISIINEDNTFGFYYLTSETNVKDTLWKYTISFYKYGINLNRKKTTFEY